MGNKEQEATQDINIPEQDNRSSLRLKRLKVKDAKKAIELERNEKIFKAIIPELSDLVQHLVLHPNSDDNLERISTLVKILIRLHCPFDY